LISVRECVEDTLCNKNMSGDKIQNTFTSVHIAPCAALLTATKSRLYAKGRISTNISFIDEVLNFALVLDNHSASAEVSDRDITVSNLFFRHSRRISRSKGLRLMEGYLNMKGKNARSKKIS
jgi:hypothetical protein